MGNEEKVVRVFAAQRADDLLTVSVDYFDVGWCNQISSIVLRKSSALSWF